METGNELRGWDHPPRGERRGVDPFHFMSEEEKTFHFIGEAGAVDEEVGAHMLVLWGIADSQEAALAAIGGEPPLATILAGKLHDRAGEQVPEKLTKRSVIKAIWDARAQLGDARKGATSGAVRNVMFTGHRTKQVIVNAEASSASSRSASRAGAGAEVSPKPQRRNQDPQTRLCD